MEDSTLEKYFEDFTEKIDGLKFDVKNIDDWQRSQYKKVIILEEHQKNMEQNIKEHKINMRWGIGIVMPTITAVFLFVVNFFTSKSG